MFSVIFKLAWKNSFLRASRTLLVIVMIAVSMSMMLGISGIYDGMIENMADKNQRSDSGDISIYAKEYRSQKDIKYRINRAKEIREEIKNIDGVESTVLRVKAEGLLSTAEKSSFASIIGIDLKDEQIFGKFSEFLKDGEIDFKNRGALIGIESAKKLKVRIGSKVVFSTQDVNKEINSIALRIRGIIQTTNINLDKGAIFVNIQDASKFLSLFEGEAMQIAVMTEDNAVFEKIKNRYPYLDVKSFLELNPMIKQMQDMTLIFNSITFFIVMGVVFVGIFGVMYVSILDRIREFGIVLALGMNYKYIRAQIILESLVVGFLGYLLGAVFGAVILIYLRDYGVDFSSFSDALEMWGYEAIIYATIKVSYFTATFIAIITASLLSVLIPLKKIKKLHPIDVIKADV
ncbi:MAG: ABC transporter permease [Sulfurimonas sp. RIFOXYD12_FULL_33_39]|uniref:FtsX-like permease family protein n=1 Tax=unclassified Sulfurimonas TaxID=2623549 RepID=UPI0008C8609F|nr:MULTISPECIES: FtsX-like permease family protein [unclassified Sulfurimonas]OHE09764.1 MAG: ABC transporter permease [Sulfurimonas sp. RIFOXYD12_FULL_33_39]OHE13728.1 MAG: ABC transporter permease [Sulfurimonas sp. RIFOXYD2_FULL_34_21]DAB28056.1 MAG TPA: ABC transporter permease [Sulfurimonas sp. UBA10385]